MTTVNVTQEFIDKGRPSECSECPVALALLAAFPEADMVSAGPLGLGIRGQETGEWHWQSTQFEVENFMNAFDTAVTDDEKALLKPFSFELDDHWYETLSEATEATSAEYGAHA